MKEFKYTVSFHALIPMEKTIKPKWWQFWKEPVIVAYEEWIRYSMLLLEDESDLLMADKTYAGPAWRLLYRALSNCDVDNIKNLQIEDISRVNNNIATEYVQDEKVYRKSSVKQYIDEQ